MLNGSIRCTAKMTFLELPNDVHSRVATFLRTQDRERARRATQNSVYASLPGLERLLMRRGYLQIDYSRPGRDVVHRYSTGFIMQVYDKFHVQASVTKDGTVRIYHSATTCLSGGAHHFLHDAADKWGRKDYGRTFSMQEALQYIRFVLSSPNVRITALKFDWRGICLPPPRSW